MSQDLPAPDARMTASRKAAIVDAVEGGRLDLADAQARYSLSIDEFSRWRRVLRTHGQRALRVKAVQSLEV
jgi:hypothetical protein